MTRRYFASDEHSVFGSMNIDELKQSISVQKAFVSNLYQVFGIKALIDR